MSFHKDITKALLVIVLNCWLCNVHLFAQDVQYGRNLKTEKPVPESADLTRRESRPKSVWQGRYYPSVFYFPIDKHVLMRHYLGNAIMLDALDDHLRAHRYTAAVDTIEIIGACSPVASKKYNMALAAKRCRALKEYIEQNHPGLLEEVPVHYSVIGIDSLGYDILRQKEPTLTQKQLWDNLQYVAIRLIMKDGTSLTPSAEVPVQKEVTKVVTKTDTIFQLVQHRDTVYLKPDCPDCPELPAYRPKKPLYVALKTNLIYDLLLVPNLSLEWYVGNNWSLAAEGNWTWNTTGGKPENRWYYRIQMAGVELRRWIKSPHPLQGHAVGLYGMIGDYDIRLFPKDESSQGELSRRSWSAGLSYGYSMPIARRLNLEFGAAAGCVWGVYYKYNFLREDKYGQLIKYNRKYIGLTRLNVSLVWMLGEDNNYKKKKKITK